MKSDTSKIRDEIVRDFLKRNRLLPGDRLPTVRALAEQYGVSCPTVGKAIALLAEEGWITKRQGSGIFVSTYQAQAVARQRVLRIGYICPELRLLGQNACEGVEKVIHRRAGTLEIACSRFELAEERRLVERMRQQGVSGVVLYPLANRKPDEEYLGREFRDFPLVVIDLYNPDMKRPHLIFDNWSAGYEMTRQLIEQGRREIVFVKYGSGYPHRAVDDRLAGYCQALQDAGLEAGPEWIFTFTGRSVGSPQHQALITRILKRRPRAIIAIYDPFARATIALLRGQRIAVPEDVLVAGFDNLQEESWGERFPTTRADFFRMGARAAELLLDRIATGKRNETEIVLPCPVVWPPATDLAPAGEKK